VTTRTILADTVAYLGTLLDGYEVKYFRWTDADESSDTPFVMLRFPGGGGASNVILQQLDVLLALVQTPTGAVTGHDDMSAILAKVRQGGGQNTVTRFEPMGSLSGPQYLENGRPVWTLNIRCYTEDY